MMNEEQIKEEIERLEEQRMTLFGQFQQVGGALAAFKNVLNPTPEVGEKVEGTA